MTEQYKTKKTIGELLDEKLKEKGLPPIPLVNQSPKRAWVMMSQKNPLKSDSKNQSKDKD